VVSDYRYRGISRSEGNPVVQGNVDWVHSSGFYAGVWASNVDFNESGPGYVEVAPYGGYKFSVDGTTLNTGLIFYNYPREKPGEHYQYVEGKVAVDHNFDFVDLNAAIKVSPNYYDDSGTAVYPTVGFKAPIGATNASITGSFGHLWVRNNDALELPDYSDWSLGLAYKWHGFSFAAQYIDTSLSKDDCGDRKCSATAMFSVSRKFGLTQ